MPDAPKAQTPDTTAKTSDTDAIKGLVKLLIDATNDSASPLGSGQKKSVTDYGNLLPDLFALVPKVGDLPNELAELKAEDIAQIVSDAAAQLKLSNDHARGIVQATVSMVSNLLTTTLRDAENVAKAIKDKQAQ